MRPAQARRASGSMMERAGGVVSATVMARAGAPVAV